MIAAFPRRALLLVIASCCSAAALMLGSCDASRIESEAGQVPADATVHSDGAETFVDGGIETCNPAPCATIYLAPSGDDAADGLSPATALATLEGAQELLKRTKLHETQHVEVRIAAGQYLDQATVWRVSSPSYFISFLPADYRIGSDEEPERPVFDGLSNHTYLVYANLPRGEATHLRFYYLHVRRYVTGGLAFVGGNPTDESNWNGENVVSGCFFEELGNKWGGTGDGYAGIALYNSRGNQVLGNHFLRLENKGAAGPLIHGLYLAHHAIDNLVSENHFEEISGDPLRVRNDSSHNRFNDNVGFVNAGSHAFYGDWYCDASRNQNCQRQECPSWDNELFVLALTSDRFRRHVYIGKPSPPLVELARLHAEAPRDFGSRLRPASDEQPNRFALEFFGVPFLLLGHDGHLS